MVCTANVCRSPVAAGLLGAEFRRLGEPGSVGSAGVKAVSMATPHALVSYLGKRGIDISGHRPTQLTLERVMSADLIVAMGRSHVREVAVIAPSTFAKTFTLKDLVRRAELFGERRSGEEPSDFLARLSLERSLTDVMGNNPDDDVSDPIGRHKRELRRTAKELEELVARLAGAIVARPRARSSGSGLSA